MVGLYDAVLGIVALPADQVSLMLPPYHVVLAEQSVTPPSTHPVVFGFGRHHHVHLTHLEWLWDQSYYEFFCRRPLGQPPGPGVREGQPGSGLLPAAPVSEQVPGGGRRRLVVGV